MKNLMSVATFNAEFFMGKIGPAVGGARYTLLHAALNGFHTTAKRTSSTLEAQLNEVTTITADILTGPKQPPPHRAAKRAACLQLAEQAGSELKWLIRKRHMGLAVSAANATAKSRYQSGVARSEVKGGTKLLSQGSATNPHDKNYWLEFYDAQHRPGFSLHAHWTNWLNLKASYAMDFWTWLANFAYVADTRAVKLADPTGNPDFVAASAGGVVTMRVRYLNSFQRLDYLITPKSTVGASGLSDVNDTAFDTAPETTCFSGNGWCIFVMDSKNKIYAGSHIEGVFHHSSFLAGAPSAAAGEMLVRGGMVHVLTGKSGHYRPTADEVRRLLGVLIPAGVVARNAALQPGFANVWYNAQDWFSRPASNPPPVLTRAQVLQKIPTAAQNVGTMMMLAVNAINP